MYVRRYHSHVLSQYTEGLWGVLIVHNTHEVWCQRYDEEFTITLTDWYHKSAHENEAWHLSKDSRGAPPYPDSVLMNGKGRYPCDGGYSIRIDKNLIPLKVWEKHLHIP